MAASPMAGAVFLPIGSLINWISLAIDPKGLNMKPYVLGLILSRHNPDIFRRNKTFDSLDGLPEEGIFSYNLEHLLGIALPT